MKTYLDKLMENKGFKEKFDKGYKKLTIAENNLKVALVNSVIII
jgi:hypothetical protein